MKTPIHLLSLLFLVTFVLVSCKDDQPGPRDNSLKIKIQTDFDGPILSTPEGNDDWAWELRGDYVGLRESLAEGEIIDYEVTVSHQNATMATLIGWGINSMKATLYYYPEEDMFSTFDGSDSEPDFIVNFHRGRKELSYWVNEPREAYIGDKQ